MRMNFTRIGSAARRGLTRSDAIVLSSMLMFLAAALPFSLGQIRAQAWRSSCTNNLRQIGQSLHIYANQYSEWFPIHYYQMQYVPPGEYPSECGVSWTGYLGSTAALLKSEETSPLVSPHASHPSRSLFMLIAEETGVSPDQFVCPDTRDVADDLWNDGWDGNVPGVPGVNRFDFRGYNYLSYAYQLPYGRRGRPRENMDSAMVVVADKGPYYEANSRPLAPTRTVNDRRSSLDAPRAWIDFSVDELLNLGDEWQPYNSRNHGGAGQNVVHVDNSVTFEDTPIVGVDHDNIYTVQKPGEAPQETLIGVVPDEETTWAPLTQTDSFLVP